ncbi:MAG: NPCBM/NEW2 domain-containing protein [Sedimentisphaerales bacterium]|nr:NPCBM/NEW2 domain-containing protein [Sedimentisphaerales bacterium]
MKYKASFLKISSVILFNLLIIVPLHAQIDTSWPHPIPCRTRDSNNPDLFMMILGDVNTLLAQGIYYPAEDQVVLKDDKVIKNYYKEILGLPYYQPVDKTHFPAPPSGWCTWYYYYYNVTADEVKANAKWIAENLSDYGAKYVQIDDGWQRGPGTTRDWTLIHKGYFPDGMEEVASYIKSVGLVPGIWLAPHGQDNLEYVKAHPNVFLRRANGELDEDTRRWEGRYLVDPSTEETQKYMANLFETLCEWGYDYFKIDGQPPTIQEYRSKGSQMKNPTDDPVAAYRKTIETIRQTVGHDRYILGCWGIPTEGAGIMNGSRTGGDIVLGWGGFRTALRAVMAYYYQHNIMWYVDPDVMVLRSPLTIDQARVWATLQGLTGQALMATDRMMDLGQERIELLRRVYPAVNIRPLDLFPAERNKRIWDLKINHLGRQYDVLGLFNFEEDTANQMVIKWSDLGLPGNVPLHVYDFWNHEYLGSWEAGMSIELPPTSCRVLTILPGTRQIQLISTNRHITQGWVDIKELKYDVNDQRYEGISQVIKNDPYELSFVFPRDKNFQIKSASAHTKVQKELPVTFANHQGWAMAAIRSPETTEVGWEVEFESAVIYSYPTQAPTNLRVERAGLEEVNLTWNEQYYLNAGYQVYLNGELLGYTPKAKFPISGLDPKTDYTVGVATVWEDGTVSRNKAELTFSIKSMIPKTTPLNQFTPIRSGGRIGIITNQTVRIGEKDYQDGILSSPGSDITYKIKGIFDSFSAMAGIGDDSGSDNGIEFIILGDGKEIWRSKSLKKADGLKDVKVDITGVQTLVLRIDGGTDETTIESQRGSRRQRNRVQAVWIDAALILN